METLIRNPLLKRNEKKLLAFFINNLDNQEQSVCERSNNIRIDKVVGADFYVETVDEQKRFLVECLNNSTVKRYKNRYFLELHFSYELDYKLNDNLFSSTIQIIHNHNKAPSVMSVHYMEDYILFELFNGDSSRLDYMHVLKGMIHRVPKNYCSVLLRSTWNGNEWSVVK